MYLTYRDDVNRWSRERGKRPFLVPVGKRNREDEGRNGEPKVGERVGTKSRVDLTFSVFFSRRTNEAKCVSRTYTRHTHTHTCILTVVHEIPVFFAKNSRFPAQDPLHNSGGDAMMESHRVSTRAPLIDRGLHRNYRSNDRTIDWSQCISNA